MANCYLCGQRNADYRRTVNTGSSVGTYYGKRSTSTSTRKYYGLRSLCDKCASEVDLGRAKSRLISAIIITIILLFILFR